MTNFKTGKLKNHSHKRISFIKKLCKWSNSNPILEAYLRNGTKTCVDFECFLPLNFFQLCFCFTVFDQLFFLSPLSHL